MADDDLIGFFLQPLGKAVEASLSFLGVNTGSPSIPEDLPKIDPPVATSAVTAATIIGDAPSSKKPTIHHKQTAFDAAKRSVYGSEAKSLDSHLFHSSLRESKAGRAERWHFIHQYLKVLRDANKDELELASNALSKQMLNDNDLFNVARMDVQQLIGFMQAPHVGGAVPTELDNDKAPLISDKLQLISMQYRYYLTKQWYNENKIMLTEDDKKTLKESLAKQKQDIKEATQGLSYLKTIQTNPHLPDKMETMMSPGGKNAADLFPEKFRLNSLDPAHQPFLAEANPILKNAETELSRRDHYYFSQMFKRANYDIAVLNKRIVGHRWNEGQHLRSYLDHAANVYQKFAENYDKGKATQKQVEVSYLSLMYRHHLMKQWLEINQSSSRLNPAKLNETQKNTVKDWLAETEEEIKKAKAFLDKMRADNKPMAAAPTPASAPTAVPDAGLEISYGSKSPASQAASTAAPAAQTPTAPTPLQESTTKTGTRFFWEESTGRAYIKNADASGTTPDTQKADAKFLVNHVLKNWDGVSPIVLGGTNETMLFEAAALIKAYEAKAGLTPSNLQWRNPKMEEKYEAHLEKNTTFEKDVEQKAKSKRVLDNMKGQKPAATSTTAQAPATPTPEAKAPSTAPAPATPVDAKAANNTPVADASSTMAGRIQAAPAELKELSQGQKKTHLDNLAKNRDQTEQQVKDEIAKEVLQAKQQIYQARASGGKNDADANALDNKGAQDSKQKAEIEAAITTTDFTKAQTPAKGKYLSPDGKLTDQPATPTSVGQTPANALDNKGIAPSQPFQPQQQTQPAASVTPPSKPPKPEGHENDWAQVASANSPSVTSPAETSAPMQTPTKPPVFTTKVPPEAQPFSVPTGASPGISLPPSGTLPRRSAPPLLKGEQEELEKLKKAQSGSASRPLPKTPQAQSPLLERKAQNPASSVTQKKHSSNRLSFLNLARKSNRESKVPKPPQVQTDDYGISTQKEKKESVNPFRKK